MSDQSMSRQQAIVDFLLEEDGPTAVEYAVLLALIAAVCIATVNTLATKVGDSFTTSGNAMFGAN